ncbi:hypothetical protein D9M71_529710 [compost metagenome]
MIAFDSQRVKSSSWMTGTMALGLSTRNSGSCVDLKPEPQSWRSKGISSSAQAQSTLRTLIDDALPSMRNIPCPFRWGGGANRSNDVGVSHRRSYSKNIVSTLHGASRDRSAAIAEKHKTST